MTTAGGIRILDEELMATSFNQNNIKLAFYLKMLDEKQLKSMMDVADAANFTEIMEVIQVVDRSRREQKIAALLNKYKKKGV